MKLSIIITNYQSYQHLLICLTSIKRFLYSDKSLKNNFEVIIVNNDKKEIEIPFSRYPFVSQKIINTKQNIGFGLANNLGSIMAKGKYLLFLNPDTVFTDNSLKKALDYLDKNKEVGIMGLKIIDHRRKSPQNWTCGHKTTWGTILFRNTINKPWNKKSPQTVQWVSGTALLIRRKIFNQIGRFDKNFFMYFEDQDLCLRVRQQGYKIVFFPYSQVIHFNGRSWRNQKEKQKRAYRESQVYFFKKHNSPLGYFFLKSIHFLLSFLNKNKK